MGAKWGTWARPWRLKKETSGGMLLEMNVHEIDLMRCILGEARSVSALGKHFINPEVDYEDLITAQIAFVSGGIGSLTTAACDHIGRYTGEVYCEKGSVYFDSVSRMVHVGKDGQEKEEIAYADVHPEWENGVYREVREFVEACLGEHPVTIPGEEGMRNVEIGEACYVSILEGRPVALPLPRS
jgi:predicted dehydrogenase